MKRKTAVELVGKKISEDNLFKHCLAVEAVMGRLAEYFDRDKEKWQLAGLLHDIDYEETKDKPEEHSLKGAEILAEKGLGEDIIYAVKVHNHEHDLPRKSLLDKALYAVDPLTGLIVASALVHPEKELEAVDTEFVLNRYEESSFARGANREVIASCGQLDLELDEFIGLALEGMKSISNDLGL